jgi:citronellol/citronellal dehydrogenase
LVSRDRGERGDGADAECGDLPAALERAEPGLMLQINVRGTFLLTQACLPRLRRSANPHVLTLSPPLNLDPRWLGAHPAYTLSKYGMTPPSNSCPGPPPRSPASASSTPRS